MIRYTVVWHDRAQEQLAQLWMNASDRRSITATAHAIDTNLRTDAELKGTQIAGHLRKFVFPPLFVFYTVSEPDRLVRINHIARA